MPWSKAPSLHLKGKHYRQRPLAVWVVAVVVALVTGLFSTLPILDSKDASAAGGQVLAQTGYIFENDDGSGVDANTQQAAGNTALSGVKKGERITARMQLTNTGGALNSDLGVFYDKNDGNWSKVQNATRPVSGTGACSNTAWECTTVDTASLNSFINSNLVSGTSLATDSSGVPWIAWSTGSDVRVGHYVGVGGSGCSGTTSWSCAAVETGGSNVEVAIAFDRSDRPWIASINSTSDVRIARYVGSGGTGCASVAWTCEAVHATASEYTDSSIVIDGSGNPMINYFDWTARTVRIARYVGSGGSGCTSSAWTCSIVVGAYNAYYSVMAVGSNGDPWLAHQGDGGCCSSAMSIAQYVGSGGTGCYAGVTDWTCKVLDDSSNNVGSNPSIAVDPSGNPWLTYWDVMGTAMRVAQYVGSGGTGCTAGVTDWTCSTVVSSSSVGQYSSIQFDPAGTAWVAYSHDSNDDLRLARYVGSGGSGCAAATWNCTSIDNTNAVGFFPSMAMDNTGTPWVSYYDSTNQTVRVARRIGSGEITMAVGRAGVSGAATSESHVDMSSTSDTSNRDDADCITGGVAWSNGKWLSTENGAISLATNQCTEVAFTLDTSQAIAGSTYRFVVAAKDSFRPDKGSWRAVSAITSYATLTIEDPTLTRISKDASYDLSNCNDTAWGCTTIDSTNNIGQDNAMAFDLAGNPWISYRDQTNLDLRVARYVGSGGTGCATSVWTCETVDAASNPTDIHGTSITFDLQGSAWISYYASAGGNLMVARYVGSGGTGCAVSTWTCVAVETTNDVGQFATIAVDSSGMPWVAHYDATGMDLRVARYVGSGGTGCASSAWTCVTLDTSGDSGQSPAIGFDPSGNPWISYADVTNWDLRVAHYVGSGGSGCAITSWTCLSVETTNQIGARSDISFDSTGFPWVSHYDLTNVDLRVVRYVGSGGTGCASSAWTCEAVDSANSVGQTSSIAHDAAGNAWISHRDMGSNNDLRVVRYVGSGGTGCASAAWTCTAVDSSANIGFFTSLAFDFSGTPWVSYWDEGNGDLKIAKRLLPPTQPSYAGRYARHTRSAVHGDARYRLDSVGDAAVQTSNSSFDQIAATSSESPLYVAAKRSSSIVALPSMSWTGQSTVSFVTRAATVQMWNNTTKAWVTPGSVSNGCSATGANTNCTITASATGVLSDYYETDGSNYWAYFRIYQAVGSTTTLSTDQFYISTSATGARAELTQRGGIWENDDGTVDSNTQQAAGNTAITGVSKGERATVRVQVDNAAAANAANLGLFYDRNDEKWAQAGVASAPVTGSGSCTDTSFDCTAVDTSNSTGAQTSSAIDPQGLPWIAYYDVSNTDLRIANYVGSNGTGCASAAWVCRTIDSTNDMGGSPSIGFDAAGNLWVAYSDNTNADLRVARYVGSGGTGCSGSTAWTCTSVETTNNRGSNPTMAFDSSGNPWIVHHDYSSWNLRIARYVGSGGTGCASSAWTCEIPDTTAGAGYDPAMAFDGQGNAVLSHYDDTADTLRVARYVGSGGSGCGNAAWSCTAVDAAGSYGMYSSIAVDPMGIPWISFQDATGSDLKVARYVGSGGTGCSASSAWTCTSVETSNVVGLGTSIAFDPAGTAWVPHYDSTNGDLRLARYVGSGGTECASAAWTCTAVDSSNDVGKAPSIVFDAVGVMWISYYDETNDDLRVAKLRRGGEIFVAAGLAGNSGDALSESHTDMTSTGDTTNRDDADCTTATATWNNGKWYESAEGAGLSLSQGNFSPQCTEVSFVIDTSQATAGTTYRFVVASKDGFRKDKSVWRGPVSVVNYPTLTVEANTTLRIAKDDMVGGSNCSGNSAWACVSPQTSGNVGSEADLDFGPDGSAWISHLDSTNGNLAVTHYVGSGGTGCATTAWDCVAVDTTGDVGYSTSIEVDLSGTPWVFYRDLDNTTTKYARYVGSGGTGCAVTSWTCEVLQTTSYVGAIAFDRNGRLWAAFNKASTAFTLAQYVGSGGTGCTSTAWTCVDIDTTVNTSTSTLEFDQNNRPWVTMRNYASNMGFRVAYYVGTGGTGCTTTAWQCTAVHTGMNVSDTVGVGFDSTNTAWIAYHDVSSDLQRLAKFVGSGGTGCTSSAWTCTTLITSDVFGGGNSFANDAAGNLWMAYNNGTASALQMARYVGSGGTGCTSAEWTCATVESGSDTSDITSLAFDRSGAPWIAHQRSSSSDLRIAKMRVPATQPSYASRYTNPSNNATQGDAHYRVDALGKAAFATDDTTYDTVITDANETPTYTFAARSATNASFPSYQWVGSSSVSNATRNTRIQVYQFGSTNAWVTLATNSTTGAGTVFGLTGTASAGSASEYWEADGGNYWAYYRVYQDAHTSSVTFSSDHFGSYVNTAPSSPTSLIQETTSDVILTTGQWYNSTSVKFAATVADTNYTDTDQLCVEVKALGQAFTNTEDACGTGVNYLGTSLSATITRTLADATEFHWQARVKDLAGLYSAWVSYDVNAESARDVGIDTTAPTGGTVYDGASAGVDSSFNSGSLTTLSANWASINSNVSGLVSYQYSIGLTAGGTTVKTWTSTGTTASMTDSSLSLQTGQMYYVNVRTTDGAGNVSTPISSNGQMVASTLTFTLSSPTITFAQLNPINSYTDTETLGASVTTNAYNGYQVTQYASGLLTYGSSTIAMYSGPWANPTTWAGTGFGYTSSDTSVVGSNRFAGATEYAGVKNGGAGGGDVIADSAAAAVGGDNYTFTYRVTADAAQAAGGYTNLLVITAIASF